MSDYDKERAALYAAWEEGERRISIIGLNGNDGDHYKELKEYVDSIEETVLDDVPKSKYHKKIKGEWLDVYDVLYGFGVENQAIAHAIKKLLCTGTRGYKDFQQDLQEAIDSLERAKDFPPVPF